MDSSDKKIFLGLVSENTEAFLNQAKLCLFSFRQNAGKLKDIPIVFITNESPLSDKDKQFFIDNFSPIQFIVEKNVITNPPYAAKLNIFTAISPSIYDIMIFMDCDTVTLKPLDDLLYSITDLEYEFICRRGGETDRSNIKDIDNTIEKLNINNPDYLVYFNGLFEKPKFNTGVFAFKSSVAQRIGSFSKEILPKVMQPEHISAFWVAEQFAIALACVENNISVDYLNEIYNSWGNLKDIKILHCFKSRYKFNREKMFIDFDMWKNKYQTKEVPGEAMLVETVRQYKEKFNI